MENKNKTTAGEEAKTTPSRKLPPRLDIRVDWAFHRIFGCKKHLQKIIRDLLEMDIEVLDIRKYVYIIVERPKELDPSFDELIEDASTQKLTSMEREDYMKALEVSERDRVVLYEGGYYMGHRDGVEEGRAATIEAVLKRLKQMGYSNEDIKKATNF